MSRTHQMATATAVAGLAVALNIGAATAPAQAAPTLSISSRLTLDAVRGTNFAIYHTDVQGVVTMSQAAAQDSINHGYTVQLRYWGDDEFSDDLLYGPIAAPNMFAAADGLHYQYNVNLAHTVLDEDHVVAGEEDEIYVGARFVDRGGTTVSQVESNHFEMGYRF
jgi:hypothetical protein